MNAKVIVATAGFALFGFAATAQTETKTKVKVKTKEAASEEAATEQKAAEPVKPVASGPRIVPAEKLIPLAEHFEGGQAAMYEFMNREMQYPMMAKRNRIQGECIVSVTLNADGSTADMKILKNMGGGLGEEALRIVRQLKFKAPGYSIKAGIPVNFKL